MLLEQIVNDVLFETLILEAKSLEQMLDILSQKYSNIDSETIQRILSIDPTKKFSYTQWVLKSFDDKLQEALDNGRLEKLFQYLKGHANEVQMNNFASPSIALDELIPQDENNKLEIFNKTGDEDVDNYDILYQSSEWIVATPNTYEASKHLANKCTWCTAGAYGNGNSYYNNYLNEHGGKYYINYDLRESENRNGFEFPFKRYQFHFESGQMNDAKNNNFIDKNPIEYFNIPEDVVTFYYEKLGYDLYNPMQYFQKKSNNGVNQDDWNEYFEENCEEICDHVYVCNDINDQEAYYFFDSYGDKMCEERIDENFDYLSATNEEIVISMSYDHEKYIVLIEDWGVYTFNVNEVFCRVYDNSHTFIFEVKDENWFSKFIISDYHYDSNLYGYKSTTISSFDDYAIIDEATLEDGTELWVLDDGNYKPWFVYFDEENIEIVDTKFMRNPIDITNKQDKYIYLDTASQNLVSPYYDDLIIAQGVNKDDIIKFEDEWVYLSFEPQYGENDEKPDATNKEHDYYQFSQRYDDYTEKHWETPYWDSREDPNFNTDSEESFMELEDGQNEIIKINIYDGTKEWVSKKPSTDDADENDYLDPSPRDYLKYTNSMAEDIRKQFNVLFERINKNYNPNRFIE